MINYETSMVTWIGRFKPFRFMKRICDDSWAKTFCILFFFSIIMGFVGFKFPKTTVMSNIAMIVTTFIALKYPKTRLWKKLFAKKWSLQNNFWFIDLFLHAYIALIRILQNFLFLKNYIFIIFLFFLNIFKFYNYTKRRI